jgi:hypothetical protein
MGEEASVIPLLLARPCSLDYYPSATNGTTTTATIELKVFVPNYEDPSCSAKDVKCENEEKAEWSTRSVTVLCK